MDFKCFSIQDQCFSAKDNSETPSQKRIAYKKAKVTEIPRAVVCRNNVATGSFDEHKNDIHAAFTDNTDVVFKETKSKKINMFLRAQNREFLGMSEVDESVWNGNYEFICMGDPQIGMGDQKKEEEFSKLAVEFINNRKDRIKFVVICGDHTHNLEDMWSKGDLEGGRKKRIQELAAFKDIYSKLDHTIPLVCVCGNHDVGNKPTEKTIQLYSKEFGDDYLSFWCGGVKFTVLNSQIVQGLSPSDELSIAHEKWADEEFERKYEDEPVHSVVMCHIPPFCWDPEEKDTNFNWPKQKREIWLEKMVKANVKKVYWSHYHRRAGGKYKDLEVVVSGALGTHIRTKEVPPNHKKSRIDEINFKLSYEGFGGVEANEETSGLQVVTVSKEGLSEEWLNIRQIKKEIGAELL